jgi:hypothetical protein
MNWISRNHATKSRVCTPFLQEIATEDAGLAKQHGILGRYYARRRTSKHGQSGDMDKSRSPGIGSRSDPTVFRSKRTDCHRVPVARSEGKLHRAHSG